MKLISPTEGFKRRQTALAKLHHVIDTRLPADVADQVCGTIIANQDGTFTPAAILSPTITAYALTLATAGLYVIG